MNISFKADGASLYMTSRPPVLTHGMQEVVTCSVVFGEEWDGLTKIASFMSMRDGKLLAKILLDDAMFVENSCTVPPEVLAHKADALFFGILGANANGTVLPTVWCRIGAVQCGATADGDNSELTPEAWAKLMKEIGNLDELVTADKTSLVAAINEVHNRGGGAEYTGGTGINVDNDSHIISADTDLLSTKTYAAQIAAQEAADSKNSLADVARTGSYNDLNDKPSIPSLDGYATEQWVEGKGYLTENAVDSVNGKTGAVVLDAQDVGAVAEEVVSEVEISTSATAVADITAENKLITPAGAKALVDDKHYTVILAKTNNAYSVTETGEQLVALAASGKVLEMDYSGTHYPLITNSTLSNKLYLEFGKNEVKFRITVTKTASPMTKTVAKSHVNIGLDTPVVIDGVTCNTVDAAIAAIAAKLNGA